jgi:sarcosine oxidase subunit alpha
MLKWHAQWRLDVDITNVTAAFAAVNVAGPKSRLLLEQLVVGLPLDKAAFPYLACRQADVAGIPARLLRVGFVGELGFEIHVPASCGEALWDAVMLAGADLDIKPFGVETQRLLRLEKGHIIVGQDSDGMSHPGELSLQWAISKNKPFYVGGRSVDIVMSQAQRRKLVGFILPVSGGRPKEGHLVLHDGDITGTVTSCEYSPSLEAVIGLAYVGAGQSEPGQEIVIRVDGGTLVRARVAEMPFYDPDNQRQEL